MKKLLIAISAIAFASTAAYAADMAMDCCKDCKCCQDKHEGAKAPAPKQ